MSLSRVKFEPDQSINQSISTYLSFSIYIAISVFRGNPNPNPACQPSLPSYLSIYLFLSLSLYMDHLVCLRREDICGDCEKEQRVNPLYNYLSTHPPTFLPICLYLSISIYLPIYLYLYLCRETTSCPPGVKTSAASL